MKPGDKVLMMGEMGLDKTYVETKFMKDYGCASTHGLFGASRILDVAGGRG